MNITIRLDASLSAAVQAAAEEEGTTLAGWCREAVRQRLADDLLLPPEPIKTECEAIKMVGLLRQIRALTAMSWVSQRIFMDDDERETFPEELEKFGHRIEQVTSHFEENLK